MNYSQIRYFLLLLLFLFGISPFYSQKSNIHYSMTLETGVSSNETLPFWLVSNRYGAIPNSDFGLLNAAIFSNLKKPEKDFGIAYKVAATGAIAYENSLIINEMYLRLQYKNWALDFGNMYDEVKWEGLSSSNGNIVKSINSRAYPGINLKTLDYIKLPFAKKWLSFQMNFANYWLNDNRFVDNAMLHSKSLYFKFITSSNFSIITGIDHYAQWAGTSPTTGEQPSGFTDFLRILSGSSGGSNALETDQLNALGNQLGSYLLQFNYDRKTTNMSFYISHIFEDASGLELQNWRDNLYGFYIDFKKPNAIISAILTEFTYTKHTSGSNLPDRGYDENGNSLPGRGHDNYFNSGVYNSGWTYFGRTIGSPYFTTVPVDENGITQGIIKGDNRFTAFNIGVKGNLNPVNFKAMLSHVTYYGWFENEYDPKPKQFSGLLEVNLPQSTKIPFEISVSTSFDTGTYSPVNFGGFLTLTRRGRF